jgi:hypothetical protein
MGGALEWAVGDAGSEGSMLAVIGIVRLREADWVRIALLPRAARTEGASREERAAASSMAASSNAASSIDRAQAQSSIQATRVAAI